eukprot:FR742087.1.p1 GENE.FR742087.1~~FR742087.1.p1  ORF type:complete len:380 (+),score=99.64 FR742087.1:42-1142(+)
MVSGTEGSDFTAQNGDSNKFTRLEQRQHERREQRGERGRSIGLEPLANSGSTPRKRQPDGKAAQVLLMQSAHLRCLAASLSAAKPNSALNAETEPALTASEDSASSSTSAALEGREADSEHLQTLQSTHNNDRQPTPAKAPDPAGTPDLGEHHHVHNPNRPHQHHHEHGPRDSGSTVSPTVVAADHEEEEDSEEELESAPQAMDDVPGADLTLPTKEKDKYYQEDDVSDDESAKESGEEVGEESAEESEEEVVNWIQGWSDDHHRHYYFQQDDWREQGGCARQTQPNKKALPRKKDQKGESQKREKKRNPGKQNKKTDSRGRLDLNGCLRLNFNFLPPRGGGGWGGGGGFWLFSKVLFFPGGGPRG